MKRAQGADRPAIHLVSYLGGWIPIPAGPKETPPIVTFCLDGPVIVVKDWNTGTELGRIDPVHVTEVRIEVGVQAHSQGWTFGTGPIGWGNQVGGATFMAFEMDDGLTAMFETKPMPYQVEVALRSFLDARKRRPAWHPDPLKRHELRWWDGTRWSEHVSDAGAQTLDPVDA